MLKMTLGEYPIVLTRLNSTSNIVKSASSSLLGLVEGRLLRVRCDLLLDLWKMCQYKTTKEERCEGTTYDQRRACGRGQT